MAQIAEGAEKLFNYGLAGGTLMWLMTRLEKRIDLLVTTFTDSHEKQTAEIRAMRHSFDGVQKSMLIVEANRQDSNPALRKAAEEMLEKIERREAQARQ